MHESCTIFLTCHIPDLRLRYTFSKIKYGCRSDVIFDPGKRLWKTKIRGVLSQNSPRFVGYFAAYPRVSVAIRHFEYRDRAENLRGRSWSRIRMPKAPLIYEINDLRLHHNFVTVCSDAVAFWSVWSGTETASLFYFGQNRSKNLSVMWNCF